MNDVNDVQELDGAERPKWDSVILVCKECRKRKNGSKDVKPKALGRTARIHLKGMKPRPRVVFTSCLGFCPKQSTAVAFVGGGDGPRVVAIDSCEQLETTMSRLVGHGRPL